MTTVEPAFRGFIETTFDALLIFEGCRRNTLPKITRRLTETEKSDLVASGAIFVFDEDDTGIKRWTDGLTWSPSRTLGNFLVYRELDKKANSSAAAAATGESDGDEMKEQPVSTRPVLIPPSARRRSTNEDGGTQLDRARERALVGSLTSSYRFRSDGLVKKTISLAGLHMVGYYRIEDVTSGRLRTPSSHAELAAMEIDPSFLQSSLFRQPPILESGPDGRMRYKGEGEAPTSPQPRATSSHGFVPPRGGQSRPDSADSGRGVRDFSRLPPPLQVAPVAGPSSQRDSPSSPQRGNSSQFRSANRYDPYGMPPRQSPNMTQYPSGSSYPFPESGPHGEHPRRGSESRSSFSNLAGVEESFRPSSASTGLSPSIGMLGSSRSSATSTPVDPPWSGNPAHAPSQFQPSSSHHSSQSQSLAPQQQQSHHHQPQQSFHSHQFYQPRQALPYSPTEPVASTSTSSNSVFRYAPPPESSTMKPMYAAPDRRPQSSDERAFHHSSNITSSSGPPPHRGYYTSPPLHQYSPNLTNQYHRPGSSGSMSGGIIGGLHPAQRSTPATIGSSSASTTYDWQRPTSQAIAARYTIPPQQTYATNAHYIKQDPDAADTAARQSLSNLAGAGEGHREGGLGSSVAPFTYAPSGLTIGVGEELLDAPRQGLGLRAGPLASRGDEQYDQAGDREGQRYSDYGARSFSKQEAQAPHNLHIQGQGQGQGQAWGWSNEPHHQQHR